MSNKILPDASFEEKRQNVCDTEVVDGGWKGDVVPMCQDRLLIKYIRISQEDESEGDSASIINQRDLLDSYLEANRELSDFKMMELCDDGYSGTNFHRPGMGRLLELVQKRKVACILVKDFSRFGRNYIEAGNYLEQVFPLLGVRFISVNDHFDSQKHSSMTCGLDMAFKNLIHDYYSKDLSIKVKTGKAVKMRKGEFTSPFAIFGYEKSVVEKNKLIIDEPAAATVRGIFSLACEGHGTTAIACILNDSHVPTPMVYKRTKSCGRDWVRNLQNNFWTSAAVNRVLRDERYTGMIVCGKRNRILGKNKTVKVPKDQWIRVPDAHEAIVSQEIFQKAQEAILAFRETEKTTDCTKPLYGQVKCGHCGYTLRKKEDCQEPYYFCSTSQYHMGSGCDGTHIPVSYINGCVLLAIQKQVQLVLDVEQIYGEKQSRLRTELMNTDRQARQIQQKIRSLKRSKTGAYESYKSGKITLDQYTIKTEKSRMELTILENQLAEVEIRQKTAKEQKDPCGNYAENFKKYGLIRQLTAELTRELIDVVRVYNTNRVEIIFKFADGFAEFVELCRPVLVKTIEESM